MKRTLLLGTVCLFAVSANAWAQGAEDGVVDLGNIDIVDTTETESTPAQAYDSFDPIDTGTSSISAEAIEAEGQGDIDTTELLRKLPNVQLSINGNAVSPDDLKEIRPQDFVISGGNYYNNNIMIDGVQANAVTDVTNDNPDHFNELAGQTAQTLYVDPSLIEEIIVRDSNISAEYGDFTGGVVDFRLREPLKEYGVSASFSYQNDSLVNFKVADTDQADDIEPEPNFETRRYSLSADLPVTEKFSLLLAYSRAESTSSYAFNENYGSAPFDNSDISQNYLVKGLYEFSDTLSLEGQLTVSPYRSHHARENRINDEVVSHSDGLSAYLKLSGEHDGWDWQSRVSYAQSDASRNWQGQSNFSWPSDAPSVDWCSGQTSCSEGGFGDIDQQQEDLVVDFKAERAIWKGLLRLGGEIKDIDVEKSRLNDNYAYSRGTLETSLSCAAGDDACIEDEVYLAQRSVYLAYDASAEVTSEALWGEFERDFADVTVRAGLRYSHDDFLDNYNLAPRLTASWQFRPEWFFTVGANRYYEKNLVAYAIRSQYPDSYIYRRDGVTDGNGVVTPGEWYIYRHTRTTDYAQAGLDTPYSDELTAALTVPTPLNGNFRLKVVHRDGKDAFARSPYDTVSFDAATATSSTSRVYSITNDGESEYDGVSAEWAGTYKNHALSASVIWSETRRKGGIADYFDEIDDDDLLNSFVYYDGQVISEQELYEISNVTDYGTPVLASLIWSSSWLNDRLSTTVGVYYRGEYETLDDTGENITIDGFRYDIFDEVTIDPYTSVNLNAGIEVFENASGRGVLDVRVENLLDDLPYTYTSSSNPYQMGRSVWLGFSYRY